MCNLIYNYFYVSLYIFSHPHITNPHPHPHISISTKASLTLYSETVRIRRIAIDKELVRHLGIVGRHPRSKAKDREMLICVIVFNDLANRLYSLRVLVRGPRVNKMQWLRRLWVTIWCCRRIKVDYELLISCIMIYIIYISNRKIINLHI